MPRKNGGKSRNRSGGSTKSVVALSLSQKWDSILASSKDSCRISDRVIIGNVTGASNILGPGIPVSPSITPTTGTVPTAGLLGGRPFLLSQLFFRYRINRLLVCYRPVVGTTTSGAVALGFLDDPDPEFPIGTPGQTTPLSYFAIDELRCSHVDSVYREVEVEWKPIDKTTWYFTTPSPTATVADQRMEYPVALAIAAAFLPATSMTYGISQLYYDITFEGAYDPSTTVA
jgi:hypothetical protein